MQTERDMIDKQDQQLVSKEQERISNHVPICIVNKEERVKVCHDSHLLWV